MIELPTIEIRPAADPAPLDRAIAELDSYDWLIFTSANGVRFFLERAGPLGARPARPAGPHLRHRSGDARGRGSPAPQGGPDGQGVRRRRSAGGLLRARPRRASACCCRAPRWRATWCRWNWRDAAPGWTWWRPTARWSPTDSLSASARCSRTDRIASPSPVPPRCGISWRRAAQRCWKGSPPRRSDPITSRTARDLGVRIPAEARPYTVDGLVRAILELYTEVTPPTRE